MKGDNVIQLASAVKSIGELAKKLEDDNGIEFVGEDPDKEAELLLWEALEKEKSEVSIEDRQASVHTDVHMRILTSDFRVDLDGVRLAGLTKKEREKMSQEIETIKHYIGYAGEYFAVGEMLLHGINAMRTTVDSGFDIVALKNNKTYHVQVKTAHTNKYDRYAFHLDGKNFQETADDERMIYIFVFIGESKKSFVVLSYKEIERQVKAGNIWKVSTTKRLRFRFYLRDEKVFLGNLENEVSEFLGNWEAFGRIGRGKAKSV